MFVICAGMHRSGSTWQYQVVNRLLERSGSCQRLGFFEGSGFADAVRPTSDARWQVLKTHEAHADFAALLAQNKAKCVYSYRDLRDAVFSIAHKTNRSFAETADWALAACKATFAFWMTRPNLLVQRYDFIAGKPAQAVQQLAEFFEMTLEPGENEEIAREFSLEENRKRTEALREELIAMGVDLNDPANALLHDEYSQLHWNHIRDAKSGNWRDQAGPAERILLARRCGRWLVDNQFETDPLWAHAEDTDAELAECGKRLADLEAAHQQLKTAHEGLRQEHLQLMNSLTWKGLFNRSLERLARRWHQLTDARNG